MIFQKGLYCVEGTTKNLVFFRQDFEFFGRNDIILMKIYACNANMSKIRAFCVLEHKSASHEISINCRAS